MRHSTEDVKRRLYSLMGDIDPLDDYDEIIEMIEELIDEYDQMHKRWAEDQAKSLREAKDKERRYGIE